MRTQVELRRAARTAGAAHAGRSAHRRGEPRTVRHGARKRMAAHGASRAMAVDCRRRRRLTSKRIIERQGQPAGDERLKTIAGSLARSARRAGDLVARFSAEEFAIILPEIEPQMMQGMMRVIMTGRRRGRREGRCRTADRSGHRQHRRRVCRAGTREDDRRRARRRRSLTRRSQARRPRPRRAPRSRLTRQDRRPSSELGPTVCRKSETRQTHSPGCVVGSILPHGSRPRFIPSSRSGSLKRSARADAAQEKGWAAIRERRHTLIAAPTGSGKTLAAFLTALDDLVQEGFARRCPTRCASSTSRR